MIKAVIFDIDDTLTTKNSWNFLATSLGATDEEERDNWGKYKKGEITREQVNKNVMKMWKKQGLDTKENIHEIFSSIPLCEDAVNIIDYLKAKNIIICLITGSLDIYAEIIAKKLDVTKYYSNASFVWDENNRIKDFKYEFDQAGLKLKQFLKFCELNNLVPEDCAVVGDSDNDYELFKITGNGIAVRTPVEDKILEGIAWKVVKNLSEIKSII